MTIKPSLVNFLVTFSRNATFPPSLYFFSAAGTGGHVDEFARFVKEDTILVAQVLEEERENDPIAAISHRNLEENMAILSIATDLKGNNFKIIRIPCPPSIYYDINPGMVEKVRILIFCRG
jgi:agmatine deiminase